ncbi:TIGR03364 family FAD-dependent oxidoreductase [Fulvivirga ulvae]|uniref:TIGR03364 family FAD-dependent oxidoreductase n=1 Tax=Fulvivirga ulvae TaxID=2904245 RepID=UPI001F20E5A9|nr:TIGR03364 family FAD-dependent oxidoreductase [Fulvivirga ulvae]UII35035.1 TIGR03364 family FAD-dependent oxidoreductase [Fulvivirga ulvae]
MNIKNFDLLVIGGGILGTFHAYHALNKGLKVGVIEKNTLPMGATVRNFGQVVPSGMNLKWQNYGRESLNIYKSIQSKFDISIRENGTVYIASDQEELQLIEELHQINKDNSYGSVLLTKDECLNKYAGLRSDYCIGGLFFPEEVTVEPRTMIHRLRKYMEEQLGLHFFPNTTIMSTEETSGTVKVQDASGNKFSAQKVIICNGNDFKSLYPQIYNDSDLVVSKLQMLQTRPQPANYKLNGSVLTGWTIRRYEAFEECPSYTEVKQKEDPDTFQKKFGVHILFKQAIDGSVILGDSHEYADAAKVDDLGFDINSAIDDFMISEAKKIVDLPTYEIKNRWLGFYSQCKNGDIFQHNVSPNVHIVTGIGGKGMTGSAGFSKENLLRLLNI